MPRTVDLATLEEVTAIALPLHAADNGDLVVMEALRHLPFEIARVFVVRAEAGAIRGQHAHRACSQFFTCSIGRIEVTCDDGSATSTYVLDRVDAGLFVPPGIWSQQTYLAPGSILTVLCDRPYEADDYIREYADFTAFRQSGRHRE